MTVSYVPYGLAIYLLDDIPALLDHPATQIIKQHFMGETFMCRLPDGEIYFESKLSLDADGSPYWKQDRPDAKPDTAAHFPDGKPLDADLVNYFVLPGGFWYHYGIRKGDIGIVIYGVSQAFACFGDVGPSRHLGEGSISLHRELGNETIRNRDTASGGALNRSGGIDRGVITIVFPKSGNGYGCANERSAAIGRPLFARLKQRATSYAHIKGTLLDI